MLYDIEESQVKRAMNGIANDLQDFEKEGILRGNLSAKVQTELISGCTKLEDCVKVQNKWVIQIPHQIFAFQ